tara:strand:- start:250 stop:495 length:246 start_codon:yes stop_codon:yes gene_type:complete
MNKPVITVKQRRNVTTISLKGSAWDYAVLPNSQIKKYGVVTALLIKANFALQKECNHRVVTYKKLAAILTDNKKLADILSA